jgi:hypothetical protein
MIRIMIRKSQFTMKEMLIMKANRHTMRILIAPTTIMVAAGVATEAILASYPELSTTPNCEFESHTYE